MHAYEHEASAGLDPVPAWVDLPDGMGPEDFRRGDDHRIIRQKRSPAALMTADGWFDVRRPDDVSSFLMGPVSAEAQPLRDAANAEREASWDRAKENGARVRKERAAEILEASRRGSIFGRIPNLALRRAAIVVGYVVFTVLTPIIFLIASLIDSFSPGGPPAALKAWWRSTGKIWCAWNGAAAWLWVNR
jgi:hypothetical protein